jgi:prephenate dehydratase
MMPVENTVAGRVADIHRLLPGSKLYIIGEHFMRVNHCLLALPEAQESALTHVHSHEMALGQCRNLIAELGLTAQVAADTAGSARDLAAAQTPTHAAIASKLAAEIYGLNVLRENIEDSASNTTRFLIMSATPDDAEPDEAHVMTSFVFRVRNVPAALYKALGGFATNKVNMTKLESYQPNGFLATQFYADIEGHPESEPVRQALEELSFYCSEMDILGVYKAAPERAALKDA